MKNQPLTNFVGALLVGISVSMTSCRRDSHETLPTGNSGTTDPDYDWEHPLPANARVDRRWDKLLTFESTRTLDQTIDWLKWAMEHYGHSPNLDGDPVDVSEVRFDHCTLRWFERRGEPRNKNYERVSVESRYALRLANVDLYLSSPSAENTQVAVGTVEDEEVRREYFEHGQSKGAPRAEHGKLVYIALRDGKEDRIADRIVWALVHAARLCGAKVKAHFD